MVFTFLILAYPGCHGKEAVKQVSACLRMLKIAAEWWQLSWLLGREE